MNRPRLDFYGCILQRILFPITFVLTLFSLKRILLEKIIKTPIWRQYSSLERYARGGTLKTLQNISQVILNTLKKKLVAIMSHNPLSSFIFLDYIVKSQRKKMRVPNKFYQKPKKSKIIDRFLCTKVIM